MTPEEEKAAEETRASLAKKAAEEEAAIQRELNAEIAKRPIVIIGGPGAFNIDGPGLGKSGRLTIGGHDITPTRWEDRTIRGELPLGLRGEVVLTRDDGVVRKGVYRMPEKQAEKQATTAKA